MKNFYTTLTIFVISLSFATSAKAQTSTDNSVSISRDVTAAGGETITNGDISITFVIGEAVGELFSNNEFSKYVTAGFAQPDIEVQEILNRDISRNFTAFPNPVRGGVMKLAFNNVSDGQYTVDIIDVLGRTVKSQVIDFRKDDFLYAEIDVSSLIKGVYFLKVGNKDYKGQVKLIKL